MPMSMSMFDQGPGTAQYASLVDAWGVDSFKAPRKRRSPGTRATSPASAMSAAGLAGYHYAGSAEPFNQYTDRYMYVPHHPRSREAGGERNVVMSEGESLYDATTTVPPPLLGESVSPDGTYMGYDDFYGNDMHYSSPIFDSRAQPAPAPAAAAAAAAPTTHMRNDPEASQPTVEGYTEYRMPQGTGAKVFDTNSKAAFDLVLYAMSGAFLIIIMEQFIQIGRMMR